MSEKEAREILTQAYVDWVNNDHPLGKGRSGSFGDFAAEALLGEGYAVVDIMVPS